MPITNLAIQRERLRHLKKLFENNKRIRNIHPSVFDKHYEFIISCERLHYDDLETLRKDGWDIVGISPLTNYDVMITVYKYDLEKQSNYIRQVSEKYNIKNRLELNFKLLELRNQDLKQRYNDLLLERNKLQKQIENLQYIHAIKGDSDLI